MQVLAHNLGGIVFGFLVVFVCAGVGIAIVLVVGVVTLGLFRGIRKKLMKV